MNRIIKVKLHELYLYKNIIYFYVLMHTKNKSIIISLLYFMKIYFTFLGVTKSEDIMTKVKFIILNSLVNNTRKSC